MTNERDAIIPPADWAALSAEGQAGVQSLIDLVHALGAEVVQLRVQMRDLQARLQQDSQNSSKPPSSDPPSAPPRPPAVPSGRKRGGQPGHPGHHRPQAPDDQIDTIVPIYPTHCSWCRAIFPDAPDRLPDVAPVIRTQVWDLPTRLIHVTEYQQHTVACPCCATIAYAPAPTGLPPGVFGTGVVALTAMLRRYRLSDRAIVDFWQSVMGMPISLGSIAHQCQQMSVAIEPLDTAIRAVVQLAPTVHVDETRWREARHTAWVWTAVTPQATCFQIDRTRSRAVFDQLLPHAHQQIITSDRYGVYHHLANMRHQLCWAHLIRDLRGCRDRTDDATTWADQMLAQVQVVFAYWTWYKVQLIDRIQLQQLLFPVRTAIRTALRQGRLTDPHTNSLRADLLRHWDALWTFVRVEDVEPTNNAAERAIRPAVLWRKTSFGTDSVAGSRFAERLLSVVATCRQQGRSVFAVLRNACDAAWHKTPCMPLFCP